MVPRALLHPVHRAICSSVLKKCDHLPHPDPYISETASSHRFQKVYTSPSKGTKIWHIGPEVHKTQEKCQNPLCWRIMNVPERYAHACTCTCASVRAGVCAHVCVRCVCICVCVCVWVCVHAPGCVCCCCCCHPTQCSPWAHL